MTESHKNNVRERARYCCEYCLAQAEFSGENFSIEHILALSRGGSDALENLALACQCCNNHKYNIELALDPATGDLVPLYNPRKDVWAEHFTWFNHSAEIIGTSSIGRATVLRLKLNRRGLMNLRRVLVAAGLHPPY